MRISSRILDSGEYSVDPKANEIKFGKSTLAQELSEALVTYEQMKIGGEVFDWFANNAYGLINAAKAHGVIIQKSDVTRKLREAESRLQQCERDCRDLEKNNQDLLRKLSVQEELIKELRKGRSSEGDVVSSG